jgi:GntR family transcriptional regulator
MTETGGRTIGANGGDMQAPQAADRVQLAVRPPAQLVPVQAHRTLAAEVTANLRQAIVSGSLSPEHELPPEPELARQLGVSRGTVRQAVTILEHEGLLSRRQGLGTFIVPHTARLRNVLNANYGLTELITSLGEIPGTSFLKVSEAAAEKDTAEKLGIAAGEPLVVIERVRTADDVPVAYTSDYLPFRHLDARRFSIETLEQFFRAHGSLYAVLRGMGLTIDGGLADLRAAIADRKLSQALQIKVGEPLLLLSQTDYSSAGSIILYSEEYLPAHINVQVWRKGPG